MIEIDKAVFRNRELVYRFITKFPSNTKWKIKIAVITICLGVVLEFSNIKSVEAISSSLLLRQTPAVRIQPNYKSKYEIKVTFTVSLKSDKITFSGYKELSICIQMMDGKFLKTSEASKLLINKIRGGGLTEVAAAL